MLVNQPAVRARETPFPLDDPVLDIFSASAATATIAARIGCCPINSATTKLHHTMPASPAARMLPETCRRSLAYTPKPTSTAKPKDGQRHGPRLTYPKAQPSDTCSPRSQMGNDLPPWGASPVNTRAKTSPAPSTRSGSGPNRMAITSARPMPSSAIRRCRPRLGHTLSRHCAR